MIVRYQVGAYSDGPSWDSLDLAIRLMQRLEPAAEIHVTHQGTLVHQIPNVIYHPQTLPDGAPYCDGRHIPLRFDLVQHEVWLDNDHIMWTLPPGWKAWRDSQFAVLIWRCDWKYYGTYDTELRQAIPDRTWHASAGMWGLPPGLIMPAPEYRGAERNQDEYGFTISWLAAQRYHEYVYQDEVPIYCPDHNALTGKDVIGTHGVHLNGLNRGWNARGELLLKGLRKLLLNTNGEVVDNLGETIALLRSHEAGWVEDAGRG